MLRNPVFKEMGQWLEMGDRVKSQKSKVKREKQMPVDDLGSRSCITR